MRVRYGIQWRIQDFPKEVAPTPRGEGKRQHTILPNFPKNCMKLKEFRPGGAPLDAPLEFILFSYFHPHIRHCRDIRVDSLESSVTTCVHLQRAVSYASCCTRCKRKPVSCSHVVMLSRRMWKSTFLDFFDKMSRNISSWTWFDRLVVKWRFKPV